MTIQELLNIIPFEILKRGESYYNTGKILQLNQGRDGTWYAEVQGNYGNYEVEIKADSDSESADYFCDCPYDGTVCKHVAAVALAINEGKAESYSSEKIEFLKEKWEQLIEDAETQDLRNFMLDFGVRNKDFRHQIMLTFSKPKSIEESDNIPYYRSQINGIFENYADREYLDYRSAYKAMNEVTHFQIKADDYYSKGNYNEAFCISAAIAIEGVNAIQNMDDSSGECGGAIIEAFQLIESILDVNSSNQLTERIFNWLLEQVQNSDYQNYGVGDSLEPLFFKTAESIQQFDVAHKFLDERIKELKSEQGWSKKYYLQKYLEHMIRLLQRESRDEEANSIIDTYLHFEGFRKIRVEQAISKADFKAAESLILEGISIAQKEGEAGTVHRWKDQLLELYKKQKKAYQSHKLAKELFIENPSDIKYFQIYRQTSPPDQWEENRTKVIEYLKKKNKGYIGRTPIDHIAQIYVEENMDEDLFEIVCSSNNIHTIIKYTDQLQSKYSSELLEYYKAAIEIEAESTGQKVYVSLVKYIEKMSKIKGGLLEAKALKNALLEKYKNRPAMKREFRFLDWD